MSCSERNRFPFTPCQWQELEQQALVFKYIVSGTPIPPDLIFTVQRSLDSSISSRLLHAQSPQIGWTGYHVRKIDPEPGRCRRTDGKKWRCSKEAHQDSKYCERHMHRGRNRSRKPVENKNTNALSSSNTRFLYDPRFPASYSQRENEQPNKVTHRFLEEWVPREKPDLADTQLSMSSPNSLHDFFVDGKW